MGQFQCCDTVVIIYVIREYSNVFSVMLIVILPAKYPVVIKVENCFYRFQCAITKFQVSFISAAERYKFSRTFFKNQMTVLFFQFQNILNFNKVGYLNHYIRLTQIVQKYIYVPSEE